MILDRAWNHLRRTGAPEWSLFRWNRRVALVYEGAFRRSAREP
jgi:hypothetical protein